MNIRKLTALILTAAVTASLLAGCKKAEETSEATTENIEN